MKYLLSFLLLSAPASLTAQDGVVPATKSVHRLVSDGDYLAFPAVLDLGGEILVSYKRGRSHAADAGATQDLLRLDKASGRPLSNTILAAVPDEIMQMGEWVRFGNGDVANYIDAQHREGSLRSGLAVVRSEDEGRTFGPVGRLGAVDGVEYGYCFDAITRDRTTWMLVMTFANLEGGKLVHQTRSQPGSVDVIRSDDNGRSWRFVRSLTKELGDSPINESAFVSDGDGFIVTARGYDNREWLFRTDAEFKELVRVDLTAANEAITSHLGRPRLFHRDGGFYLLGRNWIAKGVMQLALFRFDPEVLSITRHVILDNAERAAVSDGYYAQPYWTGERGDERFQVVTYKGMKGEPPSILRLEFDWEEVR